MAKKMNKAAKAKPETPSMNRRLAESMVNDLMRSEKGTVADQLLLCIDGKNIGAWERQTLIDLITAKLDSHDAKLGRPPAPIV